MINKKRYYITSLIAVIGSSLLAVLVSLVFFLFDLTFKDGGAETLIAFLGYITDFFNSVAVFIGFGTIIYAFFKFDFYHGVMSCLIFAGAFIPYYIYNTIARYYFTKFEFIDAGALGEFDSFDAIMMAVNYAMGSGVINQIIPSVLVAFIACKVIAGNTSEPTGFFSRKNKLQKAMLITCCSLFGINLIMLILTGVIPAFFADATLTLRPSELEAFILAILVDVLKLIALYLVFGYIIFMLVYKFYNYVLSKPSSEK